MQVHHCEQGSAEWHQLRAGIPTASEFSAILAKGEGKTRRAYMLRLAGEVLTGEPAETYSNGHMERGKLWEEEARERYAFQKEAEPELVGFITSGRKGCSPDSLIDANGALEIKTCLPHILIDRLLREGFPPEHKAQTQGILWIAEREWIDVAMYCRRLPLYVVRAHRDDAYIRELETAVDAFNDELAQTVERIRAYGQRVAA